MPPSSPGSRPTAAHLPEILVNLDPRQNHAIFQQCWNAGDVDGLVDLYEEDAVYVASAGACGGHYESAHLSRRRAPSHTVLDAVVLIPVIATDAAFVNDASPVTVNLKPASSQR